MSSISGNRHVVDGSQEVRETDSNATLPADAVSDGSSAVKSLRDPEAATEEAQKSGTMTPFSFFTTKRVVLGLMDVALLTANATQLRDVMELPYHPFKCGAFILLVISIVFQLLATGIFLAVYWWDNKSYDKERPLIIDPQRRMILDIFFGLLSLLGMGCVVVILAANIFIAAFLPTPSDHFTGHGMTNTSKCFFE
ncbi:ninjurin-1-like isoform X2 [Paramacrobiotus metropolitanus]|uniref:ninjurin-1-like isoform X2 n=1 Tax=Paramacrobiotus metropolitanus TaxID=2943436 RepID=UPI0024457124|nr:ninjurin-1-like isoform X2 [Paramacrobiotus metropolitanus]